MRADARRNRERLLEVAVRVFTDTPDAPLEAVAREAGVGIGTLYRHFPTREALIEAAYRSELQRLSDAAGALLAGALLAGSGPAGSGPAGSGPDVALRAWMDRFVDYMTTKRGMGPALRAVIASGGDPFAESRGRLLGAVGALVSAAVAAGVVRADADAEDVLKALSGISLVAGEAADREQAGRLLDLLMDGLRHGAPGARGS